MPKSNNQLPWNRKAHLHQVRTYPKIHIAKTVTFIFLCLFCIKIKHSDLLNLIWANVYLPGPIRKSFTTEARLMKLGSERLQAAVCGRWELMAANRLLALVACYFFCGQLVVNPAKDPAESQKAKDKSLSSLRLFLRLFHRCSCWVCLS